MHLYVKPKDTLGHRSTPFFCHHHQKVSLIKQVDARNNVYNVERQREKSVRQIKTSD